MIFYDLNLCLQIYRNAYNLQTKIWNKSICFLDFGLPPASENENKKYTSSESKFNKINCNSKKIILLRA